MASILVGLQTFVVVVKFLDSIMLREVTSCLSHQKCLPFLHISRLFGYHFRHYDYKRSHGCRCAEHDKQEQKEDKGKHLNHLS